MIVRSNLHLIEVNSWFRLVEVKGLVDRFSRPTGWQTVVRVIYLANRTFRWTSFRTFYRLVITKTVA